MPLSHVEVKCVHPRAQLPTYGTEHSAGADLRVVIDDNNGQPSEKELQPGEAYLFDTGLKIFVKDPNYVGMIFPRSGLGHKQGVVLGNLTGIIDADYNGNLFISLWNRTNKPVTITDGQAVAQYVILPVFQVRFEVVDEFSAITQRGEGGFGHTDHKK